jgi:hypothetical protein
MALDALDLPGPLDVEVAWAIDHDLGDRLVEEERIEWPEAPDLADQLLDQARTFVVRHGEPVCADDPIDDHLDPGLELRRIGDVEQQVEGAHDLVLEAKPDLAQQLLPRCYLSGVPRSRSRRRDGDECGGGIRGIAKLLRPLNPLEQRHDVHLNRACDMSLDEW